MNDSEPRCADQDAYITELAVAAGAGNRSALAEFIRLTQGDVWRLIARLSGEADADELTRQTFLQAIARLDELTGDVAARTWLLGLARKAVAARPAQRPSGLLERSLGRLDAPVREAFILTQALDYDYADTAAICDCSVAEVRTRVAQARTHLVSDLQLAAR